MCKSFTVLLCVLFTFSQQADAQTNTLKTPTLSANVNDLESLFTDAQKGQLDSACIMFAYKTNIPVAIITFGSANTTKENANNFTQQTDSLMFENSSSVDVAIFLSKEFRVLNFKANTPFDSDTSKIGDWKTRIQQAFTASVQPHISLLKEGKYAEAIVAILSELSAAVKKEF